MPRLHCSQKPISIFRGRHPTSLPLAEKAVAVSRNPSVSRVAKKSRHDPQDSEEAPWETEPLVYAEDGIAIPAYSVTFDNEHTDWIFWIHAMPSINCCADIALHRCQTETADFVVLQHELGIG